VWFEVDAAATQAWKLGRLRTTVARLGEPFIGFFDPTALAAAVTAAGFTEVDDFSTFALTARFLANRTDGLRLSALGHVFCARA
jgi:O-methyltransferase involved in polyketide biosynthesis